jgi:hypothetical protein
MRSLPALTEEYISAVDSKIEEIELPAESQGRYGPSRMLGPAAFFRGMFRTLVRPLTWDSRARQWHPFSGAGGGRSCMT